MGKYGKIILIIKVEDLILTFLRTFFQELLYEHILNQTLANSIVAIIMVIIWIILGFIGTLILTVIIKKGFRNKKAEAKRKKAVVALILTVLKFVFWFYIVVMIISELGVDIIPIIASAGVVALAIAFGAQDMVADFISGFFLIFEGAYEIGDLVEVQGKIGRINEIGLRKTKLITARNEVILIKNSDIRMVINFSMNNSIGFAEINVNKTVDPLVFKSAAFDDLLVKIQETEPVLAKPTFVGVITDSTFSYVIRVRFEAKPASHFLIEHRVRLLISEFVFESSGHQKEVGPEVKENYIKSKTDK